MSSLAEDCVKIRMTDSYKLPASYFIQSDKEIGMTSANVSSYRKEALLKYGEIYTRFVHDDENHYTCFYCGEPGNQYDHQPPITRVSDYRSLGLATEKYIKVVSCAECNGMASDYLSETILDRADFVDKKLKQKYKKIMLSPVWDETDIEQAQLRGRLRQSVKNHSNKLVRILDRIDYGYGVHRYVDAYKIGMDTITQMGEE